MLTDPNNAVDEKPSLQQRDVGKAPTEKTRRGRECGLCLFAVMLGTAVFCIWIFVGSSRGTITHSGSRARDDSGATITWVPAPSLLSSIAPTTTSPQAADAVVLSETGVDNVTISPEEMPVIRVDVHSLNRPHPAILTALGDGNPLSSSMLDGRSAALFAGGPADPLSRTCPYIPVRLNRKRPDDQKLITAIAKYSGYVVQYCNSSGMLQMHVAFPVYLHIIDKIALMMNITRNQRVLDVGAGCGTLLNYLYKRFNTTGTGVDLTVSSVEHATRHAQPQQLFCNGEAIRFLQLLPSNYFDATISWSVVHHIRRKQVQCLLATEMVRVTKPGGYVLIGHLRGDMTHDFWIKKRRCQIPGTVQRILLDYKAFGVEAFKRNKYPSVMIYKLASVGVNVTSVAVANTLTSDGGGE